MQTELQGTFGVKELSQVDVINCSTCCTEYDMDIPSFFHALDTDRCPISSISFTTIHRSTSKEPQPNKSKMSDTHLSKHHPTVRAYLSRHMAVRDLYAHLQTVNKTYLTDEENHALGIEYSTLDFGSGTTSNSTSSFFRLTPRREYSIAKTGVGFDEFTWYPGSWLEKLSGARGRHDCFVATYMEYASALWEKFQSPAENIRSAGAKGGEQVIYRDNHRASIEAASEYPGQRSSHRILVMASENDGEDDRITVSELEMLVSWMVGVMKVQTAALHWQTLPNDSLHIIFPVQIASFLMPTHARIIQGYFDSGKLKVQFTKLQNFNVPNYAEVMNMFLKWGNPIAQGDTMLADEFPI